MLFKPQTHTVETNTSNAATVFIRKKTVMHMTGLPSSTIYNLMAKKLFPQNIKLSGGKAVAWLLSDIEKWQADCLKNHQASSNAN